MAKIADDYKEASKLEKKKPAAALAIYKEKCMRVKPNTQKGYKWSRFFKVVFLVGLIVGIFTNGFYAMRPETPVINIILYLTLGPVVAGIGFCLIFGTVYAIFIKDKTKSEKYWYSLLGYIAAARLSLRMDKREEAIKYANDIRKFEVGIATHIADSILSMAKGKYRQAEYALRLASSIPPEGKYGHMLFESTYKTSELLPQGMRISRPLTQEEIKSDFERRAKLAEKGLVVDELHVGEYVGGDKVEIKDSVVSRSSIKGDKKNKK